MVSLFLSFSWAWPELILEGIGDMPGRERQMDGSAGRQKDQWKCLRDGLEPHPATGREWQGDVKRQNQELNRYLYMGKKHRGMGASKYMWFVIVLPLFCYGLSPQRLSPSVGKLVLTYCQWPKSWHFQVNFLIPSSQIFYPSSLYLSREHARELGSRPFD